MGYSPWGCTELNTIEVAWHACRVPGYSVLQILRVCASLVAQTVKRLPTTQETQVRSLGREDPLEKEMATHFSTLAWKIPWTEELGGLHTVHGVAKSRTRLSDFTSLHFKSLAVLPEGSLGLYRPAPFHFQVCFACLATVRRKVFQCLGSFSC